MTQWLTRQTRIDVAPRSDAYRGAARARPTSEHTVQNSTSFNRPLPA